MQAGKPGSVPSQEGAYHLSGPDFAVGIYQSTRPDGLNFR